MKSLFRRHEAIRFLLSGGVNTALALGVYWVLLNFLTYPAAYTLSFVLGVVSGYALNTYVVFKARWSWVKLMAFPAVHAVNYITGLAVVWTVINLLGVSQVIAPVIASLAVLPINFVMTRRLIKGGQSVRR